MWLLNQEQATRLTALARSRDLALTADVLAAAFPEAKTRLGDRWAEFIAHGAQRAATYGLSHLLCIARFIATWIACGAEFETRQTWAAAILSDAKRTQGAKAYQLCIRVLEQLRSAPQAGQPAAEGFASALKQLDASLAPAGALASLLPRERIRLGDACDIDAVELRLIDIGWRQHYTAQGGPWRRETCAPAIASLLVQHDTMADAAPSLPEQITLLTRPATADTSAKLRVRVKAEHSCDAQVHPLVQCLGPQGTRTLRGPIASDTTFTVHSLVDPEGKPPAIGEEGSAQYSVLDIASCGLRARGASVGELKTLLAAYDATQHLIAWRHEAPAAWKLPAEAMPVIAEPRCRREADGRVIDSSAWQQGLQALDLQLQQGLARLFTGWERESGVTDGKLEIEAALLAGTAGISWGWAERPEGIAAPPYMRLEGLFDLVACRLGLRFSGTLAKAGSRSQLVLSTDSKTDLSGPWRRGPDDGALFSAAARLRLVVRQTFDLAVLPVADPGGAVLSRSGPLQGAISGVVGLEQRPDGPGLRWFARLAVEPVVAPLRVVDALLGVQALQQPLLPAMPLVDWSLA